MTIWLKDMVKKYYTLSWKYHVGVEKPFWKSLSITPSLYWCKLCDFPKTTQLTCIIDSFITWVIKIKHTIMPSKLSYHIHHKNTEKESSVREWLSVGCEIKLPGCKFQQCYFVILNQLCNLFMPQFSSSGKWGWQ